MAAPKWAVVVPTVRPESFAGFLDAWRPLLESHGAHLIVVQDRDGHDPSIRDMFNVGGELHHWGTIKAAHVPHRTDMVRSWGIYLAWKHGAEYTLTLDDDVRPYADVFAEYEWVFRTGKPCSRFLNVGELTTYEKPLRGFPYRDREPAKVAVQYGGWHGVLDYDAPTQLAGVNPEHRFEQVVVTAPRGAAVTGCIMNAAWRTEYAPIMWQLPLHQGRFNRFGDIWAGLFAKKVLDHEGLAMVVNGRAVVRHERASNPVANLEREGPGIPVNEGLWDALREGDYRTVTDSAHRYFKTFDHEYAQHFLRARDEWVRLYD